VLAGTPFPVPPFQDLRFGNNASDPGGWGQSPLINYVQDQQVLQKRQDWPIVPSAPKPCWVAAFKSTKSRKRLCNQIIQDAEFRGQANGA
jgi:hypothetical protein